MEQAEYEREAIDWSYITFVDNQDVLDLIERRMGILDILDEQCRFPRVITTFPLSPYCTFLLFIYCSLQDEQALPVWNPRFEPRALMICKLRIVT